VITGILLVRDPLLSLELLAKLGKIYHILNILFIKLVKMGKKLFILKP
jgi:hypothetical protein